MTRAHAGGVPARGMRTARGIASLAASVTVAVWLAGCGGGSTGPPDDGSPPDQQPAGCRGASDCPPDEGCVGPEDVACGIPPMRECDRDDDCFAGGVCHSTADTCSPDGVGSRCGLPCAVQTDCGDGFVCNVAGGCVPLSCDAPGGSCSASQVCSPAPVGPDTSPADLSHGCAVIPCQDDGPCPGDTVCVNNRCQVGAGLCSPPVP